MNNRFTRSNQIARQTIDKHQISITYDNVRRWLIAKNISFRRPARLPSLTVRHRKERIQWIMQRQIWHNQQWRNAIFSDVSRYYISNADCWTRVCWRCGKYYFDAYIMKRDSCGCTNIMMWSGVGLIFIVDLSSFITSGSAEVMWWLSLATYTTFWDPVWRHFRTCTCQLDNARSNSASATIGFFSKTTSTLWHGML
jgi:hypothetical protein